MVFSSGTAPAASLGRGIDVSLAIQYEPLLQAQQIVDRLAG
jgi:hypothetical protein